jgi:hypothetical protein
MLSHGHTRGAHFCKHKDLTCKVSTSNSPFAGANSPFAKLEYLSMPTIYFHGAHAKQHDGPGLDIYYDH